MAVLQREEMQRSVIYRHTVTSPQQFSRPPWSSAVHNWPDDVVQVNQSVSPVRSTKATVPAVRNGRASPLHVKQRPSPSLSQEESCRSQAPRSSWWSGAAQGTQIVSEQVTAALLSLALVGGSAAFVSILCVQSLQSVHQYGFERVLMESGSYEVVVGGGDFLVDVAGALCMVALSLSLGAFFTAVLQLFLCLKALKMSSESHMNVMRYLRNGMFARMLSFVGFFISIPISLLGVLALMLSRNRQMSSYVTAGVFVVIALLSLLSMAVVAVHGIYAWLFGTLKIAEFNDDSTTKLVVNGDLSTLV